MLDIKLIRTSPDQVKQALRDRQGPADEKIDEILKIDEQRRDLRSDTESKKAEQNRLSKQIPIMKKNKENTDELMKSLKNLSEEIKGQNTHLNELEQKQSDIILTLSNISHSSVPVGSDDGANVEVRKHGEPRKFDFEPKAHWDLGVDLDVIDAERAAKVSGSRFVFLKGLGARLERSIISFFMDNHSANGYTEVLPPYMVNRASMTGTGQLPKFEDDAFKVTNNGYFLIPTAEVPVTNLHRDEILMGDNLPVKYCAYSACFRAEIGSAGRDTRGIIRQHQFNKVELVKFAEPETSYNELELLTNDAERLLQILELPYRVVNLCTGDLGFSSAKTYDLEVWLPSYNRYMEISSCSNFEDFQARRAAIRYKKSIKDKTKLVHTLNGSGLAVGRTVAAIMENYQNEDGSITVPEALRSYMGTDVIK